MSYYLGRCPKHGEVHAKRVDSEPEMSGEGYTSYLCPGEQIDRVCLELVERIGGEVDRPEWAEYAGEH